jgi:hypothetical protein
MKEGKPVSDQDDSSSKDNDYFFRFLRGQATACHRNFQYKLMGNIGRYQHKGPEQSCPHLFRDAMILFFLVVRLLGSGLSTESSHFGTLHRAWMRCIK